MDHSDNQLSAEVEPFIPQRKGGDVALVTMNWPREGGGPGGGAGAEATPIPSYLITCFPFVQENQPNSRYTLCNGDPRWQQPSSGPGGPYLAYPLLTSPQPPVSSDYAYYQLLPAPCSPMMGFYPPFPTPYGGSLQTGVVSPVPADGGERVLRSGQEYSVACQRGRGTIHPAALPTQFCQPMRAKREPMRSVAVQKENGASGSRPKTILLVDAAQQTDFPGEVASALPWKSRARRRRALQQAMELSSEHGASEADIDSDSGYCSPKHNLAGAGLRPSDPASTTGVEAGVMTALSWVNVASQKPWMNRKAAFLRPGSAAEQRNYAQLDPQAAPHGRVRSISIATERGYGLQNRLQDGGVQNARAHTGMATVPLYFEDEDEFPELVSTGAPVLNKQVEVQPKIPKHLVLQLENLPESSPMSIVQTPIPITTSVPKRAKSQRKKALAAALATAQEYSEISMEQRKLQEALTKAAGKKSKVPVQLDLGDMLAALERQQQAMRARQINNTKPLSYTVGTTALFHRKDSGGSASGMKSPQYTGPHNILDSSAPRVKRGKEREIPKVKRPTALKKVILKEREGKKGRPSLDQDGTDPEEQGDEQLHLSQGVSQEDNGLSVPSDASLSPASQNSPYSITPISGSPASSGIGSPMAASAITKIHSRRFREYCNQVLNKDIDESVTLLLQELMRFQERVYQKDPIKAKAKRRLVMGLREVTKHMRLHNVKCVLISPNCEKIQAKGGLDEALYNVIAMAREQEIPFVFALGRKALGRCVNKLVPVSVVGIFNYCGAEGLFSRLVLLTEEARRAYRDMVSALEQEQAEEALKTVKRVPHHMGHSRNPSAASAISFCSVISEPISEVNEREYETNWRNMVETSDGAEAESEREACDRKDVTATHGGPGSAPPAAPTPAAPRPEREEGRPDDRLELATASTLVPGMLEEEEDQEEEGEEPVSKEMPSVSSRIESWVSETLQNLQLGVARDSAEEEDEEEEEEEESGEVGRSDEEELDSPVLSEPGLDQAEQMLEVKSVTC
ncbi:hypothetical protein SKAU_G00309090 [Synaphobranchus kaupii]|uniref:Ribosomal protein eL8/eL30/eS12/Gadd45 domain-containing protein n=1 Tax=Synaphobranchus kaupii TaxID=118154 RepID=A0A9Q1ERB2_SYNKA|nr:hypothetical protein SKAU_G00309090 [Synaphobranchus kaupii]